MRKTLEEIQHDAANKPIEELQAEVQSLFGKEGVVDFKVSINGDFKGTGHEVFREVYSGLMQVEHGLAKDITGTDKG